MYNLTLDEAGGSDWRWGWLARGWEQGAGIGNCSGVPGFLGP